MRKDIDHLVAVFAENVAKSDEHLPVARWNARVIKAGRTWRKLRDLGDEGIDAFATLLDDPRPEVRLDAAGYLLKRRTSQATAALQHMVDTEPEYAHLAQRWLEHWERTGQCLDDDDEPAEPALDPTQARERYQTLAVATGTPHGDRALQVTRDLAALACQLGGQPQGQRLISRLRSDDAPRVAFWAAVHSLDWSDAGRKVLRQLATQTDDRVLALDAQTALWQAKEGLLTLEEPEEVAMPPATPEDERPRGRLLTREEISAGLRRAGLARVHDALMGLLLPALRLRVLPADEDALPVGASKIGGLPDLPPSLTWPVYQHLPMTFVGQFRLEDVAAYNLGAQLPPAGMLYFFYDSTQETYGDQPGDRGSGVVYYAPPEAGPLQRRPLPFGLSAERVPTACGVRYLPEWTLPDASAPAIAPLGLTADEGDTYARLREQMAAIQTEQPPDDSDFICRLLGHPDPWQQDPLEEAVFGSQGLYTDQPRNGEDPRIPAARTEATRWRLLLQLSSDEALRLTWNVVGRLYFCLPPRSLASRFDHVWTVMQN